MAEKKENSSIVTGPFRLAFPQVFEAKASVEGGKEKFSITMLFPKSGESFIPSMPYTAANGLVALRKLALDAVKEKWGEKEKWPGLFKTMDFKTYISPNGKDGWPIRDGESVEWDGFASNFFVRASSQFQPGLVDAKLQPVLDKQAFYGGLICRAQINCFAYDNAGNKGISFGVNNVQILKDDGVTFGGKQKPELVFDAFGSVAPGDTDEDAWN